jgi:hypothetical protein
MQEATKVAIDSSVRYRRTDIAVVRAAPRPQIIEHGLLLVMVCLFWGVILFEALALAVR